MQKVVHQISAQKGREKKNIIDIGETGWNLDHDVVPEMICLDLDHDSIFAEEDYDSVSSYEFVTGILLGQYFLKALKNAGRAMGAGNPKNMARPNKRYALRISTL